MDGNFRKKIALKLKEPSSSTTLTSTVAVEQTADLSTVTSSNIGATICSTTLSNTTNKNDLINRAQELNWDQPVNLVGRAILDPLIHICEICDRPILIYGRMKKCRHAFCRECVKKASGECPKCHNSDQAFEEASMGSVHICTFGGGRYDNKGCGRSYLSQRDLDAHIAYRHNKSANTATKFPSLQIPHAFFQSSSAPCVPVVPGGALPHNFPSQLPPASLASLNLSGFTQQPSNQPRFPQPGSTAVWTRPPGYQ